MLTSIRETFKADPLFARRIKVVCTSMVDLQTLFGAQHGQ